MLISGIQGSVIQVIVYGIEPSTTLSADHHTRLALADHVGASACAFTIKSGLRARQMQRHLRALIAVFSDSELSPDLIALATGTRRLVITSTDPE